MLLFDLGQTAELVIGRRTAHELGISRTKLYAKLAKYQLDAGRKRGGSAGS